VLSPPSATPPGARLFSLPVSARIAVELLRHFLLG